MALYRLTLRLMAPLGTPLTGSTLFGQLCWLKREAEGEAALIEWLRDEAAIWRISDGFPAGCLPRPLVRPRALGAADLGRVKEIKRRPYIRRATWLARRSSWTDAGLDPVRDLHGDFALLARVAHNTIDRRTATTPKPGGLHFVSEDWRFTGSDRQGRSDLVDLYVDCAEPLSAVRALLSDLGDQGYGRDASTGRGRWTVDAAEEDPELAEGGGDRRMSLSRGFLVASEMPDAYWRIEPLFGKAGPQITTSGASPFKKPVLLTKPGMSFRPVGAGPWGRWMTGVHPSRPEIGVNGLHVTIPFAEAEP